MLAEEELEGDMAVAGITKRSPDGEPVWNPAHTNQRSRNDTVLNKSNTVIPIIKRANETQRSPNESFKKIVTLTKLNSMILCAC